MFWFAHTGTLLFKNLYFHWNQTPVAALGSQEIIQFYCERPMRPTGTVSAQHIE
ncbi:hypothetical protein EIO_3301 (plasmid) [Ketogulonicigenium vulgare Y25]|uniref:Uncharacterized protein n=1 Tax=Ketogulonicigenium vulgare (strain WSH-001) TaxID=759362 RepID=F9YBN6_KETVW|nr:hypothetical protein EIO_3301 [Ketogulonicigenium vulgare Y25]AEM42788.1 hypothetical protein KVU_PB0110 [Ketogulonicigenium vulgare WSH-001]ALJ82881.1 hypothetical protein KVH_15820 [Ketogulonicigenium vulgare]